MTAPAKQLVVITGMSGSGKSTAIRALEDAGFFCIDNLPVLLLPKLTELAGGGNIERMALVMDVREGVFLKDAPRVLDEVRRAGHHVEVLFLDSSDDSLIRRFSETRRRHPLAPNGTVADGIKAERQELRDLREIADQVIDSSVLNVHDLKRMVQARFSPEPAAGPSLSVMSFGYRYGVPPQADLVLDVRFLPNPYFVPEMKGLTGKVPKVAAYVLDREETQQFLEKVVDLCRFLFPRYQKEGKAYLTVALGCTGGKHRSVAIAAELTRRLADENTRVQLWDRDIEKE
ncbi:RNase adapter RapZ [Myxococcus sp. CA051A]|uniref:RNase adapter RapZ n=1 Tax=Myxococcus llanfairpwllgwyngyllgogerychwyrndrobwllllantysiliogogogochensis TaxID=2590453 RepID=A0A540WXZ2_9BACT|nr:RNase adapter RapZ [Myxococcus llanfairpwllgwyngyllgogerychwyrndrobwllllantysiliogogogochensis]NTX03196.1 RNase adapter RapZ [Myxococcus sp. CA040A]NTX11612.1 RNase adapter RapZ [Myxococcus sp. CA056]NTX34291.1 RNase adapter RapZ [Myxococcus sp. CA033]NTX52711.1 RNase adapter RapZ [Myxococcus sp. CA039A]NTX60880.1 RNase adapter RapZ [Myxococcus sp. CA051A]